MNVPFLNLKLQYEELMDEINQELKDIFSNTAFIGGTKVKKFEEEVASYLGVRYAVGCASGTDALVLALRACGIQPGGCRDRYRHRISLPAKESRGPLCHHHRGSSGRADRGSDLCPVQFPVL